MCVSVHIHVSQQVHGDRKTMIWTQPFHFHWYPGIKVRLSSGDDIHWLWSLLWSNQLKTLYFLLFNYFVLKNIYIYIWRVIYGTLQELGRKSWNLLKAEKIRRNLGVQVWHVDFDFISFAVLLNWSSFLPSNFCKVPIMTWARPWHGSFPVFASSCHFFYVAMKSF